ncbi:hypothetical protein J6590_087493 [Homalodisca vitripennis]|nr:hypothetical protein J6590_087493 [Homalodisca vitripennis]
METDIENSVSEPSLCCVTMLPLMIMFHQNRICLDEETDLVDEGDNEAVVVGRPENVNTRKRKKNVTKRKQRKQKGNRVESYKTARETADIPSDPESEDNEDHAYPDVVGRINDLIGSYIVMEDGILEVDHLELAQTGLPIFPQHPPKATDTVTNELFETMRNRRPDPAPRAASLVSDKSSVSTTTHRRPRPTLDMERCLLDTLRGKELCTKTIMAMKTLVHTVETRELVEATRSIMYVSPDAAVQKRPPPDYPTFDPHNYLFCGKAQSFGYDYRTLYYNQHLRERSLTHALKPGCKRDPQKMSLDLVFRKALKEIAEELHEIDPEPLVVSLENPVFISGRYLELRLLKKLGEFYRVQCNGLDLSKYLTQSSTDKTSPLKQYVDGSRCEEYVRVLHDRYALNSGADLINAKAKSLIMPSSTRVSSGGHSSLRLLCGCS